MTTAKDFAAGGYPAVFLTLSLCLALPFGGVGIVAAVSLLNLVTSPVNLLPQAVRLYFGAWIRSDAFKMNVLIFIVTLLELGLLLYHHDDQSDFENQLKQYLVALAILVTFKRHPVSAVIWGSAIGCLVAGLVAFHDIFLLNLGRAEGPTNSIRFGMMASLMAMFCLAAAIFGDYARRWRNLLATAAVFGLFALFWSGSRGAVLALPFMLAGLLFGLWNVSRRATALFGIAFIVCALALGAWQLHALRGGVSNFVASLKTVAEGGVPEKSTRDRIEMLRIAAHLFRADPWTGAGASGWDSAVAEQMQTSSPEMALSSPFNQPHNQYANDFAKGGIGRGLGGLAMILVPLWLFVRRGAFAPVQPRRRRKLTLPGVAWHNQVEIAGAEASSLAPLLGVVTCVGYAGFGLTESVMDLSLTASIYAILIFYLICASEGSPLTRSMAIDNTVKKPRNLGAAADLP